MSCVYLITNLVNDKYYVGKTIHTAERRWKEHVSAAHHRGSAEARYPLHCAIRKYGAAAFSVQVLSESGDTNKLERLWIEVLDATHRGYNLTLGGEGVVPLPEMRRTHAAPMNTPEANAKKVAFHTGRKRSVVTKGLISAAAKTRVGHRNSFFGKHHTAATLERQSAAKIGKKLGPRPSHSAWMREYWRVRKGQI
jgi:group I intron endonuclease